MTDDTPRTRIAVLDGASRLELALTPDVVLGDALTSLGVDLVSGRRVLIGRGGHEVWAGTRAGDLEDGSALALVDLDERARTARRRGPRGETGASGTPAAWWMLAAVGILLAVVALLLPDAIDAPMRFLLTVVVLIGAATSAAVWARRERAAHGSAAATAAGPLLLAFAAGVVSVPVLPEGTGILAVVVGLCLAAVLSALLAVVARASIVRAELGTITLILLGLAIVWGLALLWAVPVSAPAAVSLGAVPLALRGLPSTLLDVPPGMFIEYRRFQTARWAVREQLPADGGPIGAAAAKELVGRSAARLLSGTALLSAVAAVCAPFALPSFDASDPIVLGGRIGLAVCASLALLLGSRRSSSPALHWMPRAAALVVIGVSLLDALRISGPFLLTVLAGATLALAVAVGLAVVPVARGARSLFWSRFGDVFEWLAVVLALPAGLLAADTLDIVRGMMGA